MKRITRRVQALNERASELTAAASQLPRRVAELRQVAEATTSELQNLTAGIQVNVPDLLVKREDELSSALAEVAAHAPVFAEAGFILDGLDLEISPLQQVIVQLLFHSEAETLSIQPLIQRHQQQKYVRAILSAIVKAKAVVSTVDIDGLDYRKLTVAIGPVPTIRLCWRGFELDAEDETAPAAVDSPAKSKFPAANTASFFDTPPPLPPIAKPKPASPAAALPSTPEPAIAPELPTPKPTAKKPAVDPNDPLARFKVMPNYNRR